MFKIDANTLTRVACCFYVRKQHAVCNVAFSSAHEVHFRAVNCLYRSGTFKFLCEQQRGKKNHISITKNKTKADLSIKTCCECSLVKIFDILHLLLFYIISPFTAL